MNKPPKLFVTGTMRTGGSLLINLLSAHPKLLILNERVHFFRFVYGRYDPLNHENLDYMLNDQRLRLKYRKGIDLKVDLLRNQIDLELVKKSDTESESNILNTEESLKAN